MGASIWKLQFGRFSLVAIVWEPSFHNVRLGTFALVFRTETFAWELSLWNFTLGAFPWDFSHGVFRLGSFNWDLSWELSVWFHRLGHVA